VRALAALYQATPGGRRTFPLRVAWIAEAADPKHRRHGRLRRSPLRPRLGRTQLIPRDAKRSPFCSGFLLLRSTKRRIGGQRDGSSSSPRASFLVTDVLVAPMRRRIGAAPTALPSSCCYSERPSPSGAKPAAARAPGPRQRLRRTSSRRSVSPPRAAIVLPGPDAERLASPSTRRPDYGPYSAASTSDPSSRTRAPPSTWLRLRIHRTGSATVRTNTRAQVQCNQGIHPVHRPARSTPGLQALRALRIKRRRAGGGRLARLRPADEPSSTAAAPSR